MKFRLPESGTQAAAKIDATHVPYKGVGPAVPDLISGQAHVMVNAIPESCKSSPSKG